MARPSKTQPAIDTEDTVIDKEAVSGAMVALREQTQAAQLAAAQHESAVRAVAQRVGYALDAIEPDLIQRDIAANMRRSVEACLEVGRGLCVLKAACAHGDFMLRLEALSIEYRLAARFMQAALKFSNVSTSTHLLKAAGTQSKLFELLVLDDEQIEAFELQGEVAGVTLEDVARMGVRELRAALREARAEKAASERLIEAKNKQIDKLQLLKTAPPDEQVAEALKEMSRRASEALGMVRGPLRLGFAGLQALEHQGERSHRGVMKGVLDDLQREIDILRADFFLLGEPPRA